MKFNTPLPQPLQKECLKAAQIFKSFVDNGNNGLDGVIPRTVLENAKGFALFTIFKAGFLFSARAGSGVVIAKLEDGTWSAPSAIGTAGLGIGGQAGAEMTDFLVVLNSRSAVRSFMSAGSLTLGGNLSVAVGPLGRNGEAIGSLNTSGKVAAMYSYSKTRGLFGGVSIEGSVIVERQDANAQAYHSDVTVKQLLSGAVPPPEWASPLIKTLESCTGMPGGRKWVQEFQSQHSGAPYMFGSVESPGNENGPSDVGRFFPDASPTPSSSSGKLSKNKKGKSSSISFPPVNWGRRKSGGSYFSDYHDPSRAPEPVDANIPTPTLAPEDRPSPRLGRALNPATGYFETTFQSDYDGADDRLRRHPPLGRRTPPPDPSAKAADREAQDDGIRWEPGSPFNDLPPFSQARSSMSDATSHRRAFSAYAPSSASSVSKGLNPFEAHGREVDGVDEDLLGLGLGPGTSGPGSGSGAALGRSGSLSTPGGAKSKIAPKAELARPLLPHEGVARAIALYNFTAVQPGDLSFQKGQVITVTEMSDDTNTWWKGKVDGAEGIFPANFVEVV